MLAGVVALSLADRLLPYLGAAAFPSSRCPSSSAGWRSACFLDAVLVVEDTPTSFKASASGGSWASRLTAPRDERKAAIDRDGRRRRRPDRQDRLRAVGCFGGQPLPPGTRKKAGRQPSGSLDVADLHAALDELGARRLDIGDDHLEALHNGSTLDDPLAHHDRAGRARRRQLHETDLAR